ncbi:alpha/beta hydrolase [Aminobacter sp. AP02]|uniref:alpha/beta fold hydrolase n=1 Tax=Aminobacter sp. AP02 TaxID=2135737 RepID=UPI000D799DA7|nr:alpha/beta hydrolase [Aminobacter sp. AP02]PWK68453.1 pimeloyl-ACP methyl ester carboxylesterase [Aminobacter sp. AP02]
MTPKSSTLKVPGAKIHYEALGSGPLLLTIAGGPSDAGVFAGLSRQLADRYTVVAYDPRGNSRSHFDGEPVEQQLDVHGDDAARLIDALSDGPAFVLGNSGGAQIGLNLAARHPERVRVLVAHEPPCLVMLDDPEKAIAADREIYETYLRDGIGPAMAKFMVMAGLDDEYDGGSPEFEPSPEDIATFARMEANFEYFIAHGLMPLSLYCPDVAALRAGEPRVVVGIGEETVGQITHRTSVALAAKLGAEPVVFPGGHGGFGSHSEGFARTLHQVLDGQKP